jgi:hypothetical protein
MSAELRVHGYVDIIELTVCRRLNRFAFCGKDENLRAAQHSQNVSEPASVFDPVRQRII